MRSKHDASIDTELDGWNVVDTAGYQRLTKHWTFLSIPIVDINLLEESEGKSPANSPSLYNFLVFFKVTVKLLRFI
jgi:hypothetical protein